MALQKIKNLRTGFAIEHWEIISINIDFQKGYARALLAGYKDEAIYNADKGAFVETYPFEFQVTHELVNSQNILDYAYAQLQEPMPVEEVVEPGKEEVAVVKVTLDQDLDAEQTVNARSHTPFHQAVGELYPQARQSSGFSM